jgi:hypothetical protein
MSEEQNKQMAGVPVDALVAYLSDLYRQLDNISFNIRTNIQNILPKVEGEVKDADSNQS